MVILFIVVLIVVKSLQLSVWKIKTAEIGSAFYSVMIPIVRSQSIKFAVSDPGQIVVVWLFSTLKGIILVRENE